MNTELEELVSLLETTETSLLFNEDRKASLLEALRKADLEQSTSEFNGLYECRRGDRGDYTLVGIHSCSSSRVAESRNERLEFYQVEARLANADCYAEDDFNQILLGGLEAPERAKYQDLPRFPEPMGPPAEPEFEHYPRSQQSAAHLYPSYRWIIFLITGFLTSIIGSLAFIAGGIDELSFAILAIAQCFFGAGLIGSLTETTRRYEDDSKKIQNWKASYRKVYSQNLSSFQNFERKSERYASQKKSYQHICDRLNQIFQSAKEKREEETQEILDRRQSSDEHALHLRSFKTSARNLNRDIYLGFVLKYLYRGPLFLERQIKTDLEAGLVEVTLVVPDDPEPFAKTVRSQEEACASIVIEAIAAIFAHQRASQNDRDKGVDLVRVVIWSYHMCPIDGKKRHHQKFSVTLDRFAFQSVSWQSASIILALKALGAEMLAIGDCSEIKGSEQKRWPAELDSSQKKLSLKNMQNLATLPDREQRTFIERFIAEQRADGYFELKFTPFNIEAGQSVSFFLDYAHPFEAVRYFFHITWQHLSVGVNGINKAYEYAIDHSATNIQFCSLAGFDSESKARDWKTSTVFLSSSVYGLKEAFR